MYVRIKDKIGNVNETSTQTKTTTKRHLKGNIIFNNSHVPKHNFKSLETL